MKRKRVHRLATVATKRKRVHNIVHRLTTVATVLLRGMGS